MKKHTCFLCLLLLLAAELVALVLFAGQEPQKPQDAVAVNEAVQSVQADWNAIEKHKNQTSLDYVVLDRDNEAVFRTRGGLSENIHQAVVHRDTILDIEAQGAAVGKILIYNDSAECLQRSRQMAAAVLAAAVLVQCAACIGFFCYVNHTMIKPFYRLKDFAGRVAGGNLDIPLTMDRLNLFGAFTESFDTMRTELKKARLAEAKANADKKELVAKLSHDIKTPVASIKAASEVGAALAGDEKIRDNYTQIIRKADQINVLVTNLFTAALEELEQLPVTPADLESGELRDLLESADYLHRAEIPEIPDGLLYADRLRLQQVFDNIFANSYKYAGTEMEVKVGRDGKGFWVAIEDCGGGVDAGELPLLKEKFKRGSRAGNIEGAGLGLFISDYFMKEMQGELLLENGRKGLRVTVRIAYSGTI